MRSSCLDIFILAKVFDMKKSFIDRDTLSPADIAGLVSARRGHGDDGQDEEHRARPGSRHHRCGDDREGVPYTLLNRNPAEVYKIP